MFRLSLLSVAAIIAAGFPASAQDAHSVVAEVAAQYDKVWNTRNAQDVAALYTSDGIIVPPGTPAGSGHDAIVAFFQPLFVNGWSTHRFEPATATQLSDTTIVASMHWAANLTDANGKTTRYHGDSGQVLTKIGDQWKIKLASWNVIPDK